MSFWQVAPRTFRTTAPGDVGDIARGDHPPGTHHSDPVAQLLHLVKLMRNKKDGVPLVAQMFEFYKKLLRLLGRKNSGRLVQNQDFRAFEQGLDNFNPLFQPDCIFERSPPSSESLFSHRSESLF